MALIRLFPFSLNISNIESMSLSIAANGEDRSSETISQQNEEEMKKKKLDSFLDASFGDIVNHLPCKHSNQTENENEIEKSRLHHHYAMWTSGNAKLKGGRDVSSSGTTNI